MESEVCIVKKRFLETKESERLLKENVRVQQDKSRQLLAACLYKIKETESYVEKVRVEKDNELALIARELTLLQSNMLKDQKRLEGVIADKQAALDSQSAEADRLRKQNKKLQLQLHSLQSKSKQQLAAMQASKDTDMDTPSSETDSSPKSSFSTKSVTSAAAAAVAASPVATAPSVVKSNSNNTITKVIEIKSDEGHHLRSPPTPQPVTSGGLNGSLNQPAKPPIPSRAGVNKKLLKSPQAPVPPPRTGSVPAQTIDSGRESGSDENHHMNILRNNNVNGNVTITTLNHTLYNGGVADEGFMSEEIDSCGNAHLTSPPSDNLNNTQQLNNNNINNVLTPMTRNHRTVQKPSEVKQRSQKAGALRAGGPRSLRASEGGPSSGSSKSKLGRVIEEPRQMTTSHCSSTTDNKVTTVTYWTEPYL